MKEGGFEKAEREEGETCGNVRTNEHRPILKYFYQSPFYQSPFYQSPFYKPPLSLFLFLSQKNPKLQKHPKTNREYEKFEMGIVENPIEREERGREREREREILIYCAGTLAEVPIRRRLFPTPSRLLW